MTPRLCKAARALLNMTADDLGLVASVNGRTILNFERGDERTRESTIATIAAAFATLGIAFIEADGIEGFVLVTPKG